ncbi:YbaB/EbfC family nucleoid-associated protein [Streptomyces sp. NPDC044984]|uniref:YbaB/EbfC family nucleoid-associated protein n=1 Tax=Streptomyces sp. NPDC044984 TaxID=3154335 RepID=UPI0033F6E390
MSQSMEDRLARVMARLKETEEAVARAQHTLDQASATAHSSDRSVRVTVGAKGDVTQLEFLDGKYKTMPPAKLSGVVLEAMNAARAQMARQVVDLVSPVIDRSPGDSGLKDVNVDWNDVFGSLLEDPARSTARTPMSRLRDEIHEDEEDVPADPPAGNPREKKGM